MNTIAQNVSVVDVLVDYVQRGFGKPLSFKHFSIESLNDRATVAMAPMAPTNDLTSYATIGLSRHSLNGSSGEMPFRVELVTAALTATPYAEDILAYTYHYFVKHKVCLAPGQVLLKGIQHSRIQSPHLEHIYLAMPAGWNHGFYGLRLQQYDIRFLMPIAISEREFQYVKAHGIDKFENLITSSEVDAFDLSRQSAA